MNRKQSHPRALTPDSKFIPAELRAGDEYFVNGIFEFNITRMIVHIKNNPGLYHPEKVSVSEFCNDFSVIDEGNLNSVILDEPVILAEIAPDRYNLIDGNHRMEKAKRLGHLSVMAYKLSPVQHAMFLTSLYAYEKYITYWNEKLSEF